MQRRDFLKSSAAAVISGAAGKGLLARTAKKKPNLLFIFPDQFRVQALGFTGEDPTITPNLNKFARESLNFYNAVSNRPLCSPYRGMLMTGKWPYTTGITTNCNSSQPDIYLRNDEVTFTDALSNADYQIGYLGKWHLDTPRGVPVADHWKKAQWDCYVPPKRRHSIDYWHAYNCKDRHMNPHYWIKDAGEDDKAFFDQYSPIHEAETAEKYIKNEDGKMRDSGKPFALFAAMNPPHPPYHLVPDKYKKLFKDKSLDKLINRPNADRKLAGRIAKDYFAQVAGVDDAFGMIMDALEKSGEKENTIVVFTADHGEMMGSHNRKGKGVIYEESFRIPLLVRWPDKIMPGKDGLHINVPDTMPTLLGLMGLEKHIPKQAEGKDYSKVFEGKEFERPNTSFFISPGSEEIGARGVRSDRYTYEVKLRKGKKQIRLFDRKKDPYQMQNIAYQKKDVAEIMHKELQNWLEKTRDPYAKQYA
ncbi:sulfatase family protein [Sedimentisphaera salicampi]|uniref:sulfatase family protein n=1 Tax=Sedimentisphaera salicampi TaxID=1941349 RepID=UPI000B9B4B8B|nr:sulfatase [Sedimentisphaera salicampi]OXU16021.1 Arylsulfatase [Sedimentisphaera salicampi]